MGGNITQIVTGVALALVAPLLLPAAIPLTMGTMLGSWAVGFGAGYFLGGSLFPSNADMPGADPGGLQLQTSQLGCAVPVVYGTPKKSGNLIWYGNFTTVAHEEESGGKGGGGGATTTSYTYTVGIAWGLCMSPPDNRKTVLRVWAGKDLIDSSRYTVYDGSETEPDPYIQSVLTAEGKTRFPVWKNLLKVVMEDYNLGSNPSIPQFTFEVASLEEETEFISWEEAAGQLVATEINCLAELNGKKYGGTNTGELYEWNDVDSWSSVAVQYGSATSIKDILVENDEILAVTNIGTLQKWNGSDAWIHLVNAPANFGGVESNLCKYNGKFYVSMTINSIWGILHECNGVSGTWLGVTNPSWWDWFILSLCVFEGSLFGGQGGYGVLKEWNNVDDWINRADTPNNPNNLSKLVVLEDNLYGVNNYNGKHQLYRYDPGIMTEVAPNVFGGTTIAKSLIVRNGNIYMGTGNAYNGGGKLAMWNGVDAWVEAVDKFGDECQIISLLSSSDGLFGGTGIFGAVGGGKLLKIIEDETPADVLPSDVSKDVLTNDLYGLGLSESYLNLTIFEATRQYCEDNDMKVSFNFDSQRSVLDALSYVITHHNGFITYYDGLIAHNQLQAITPTETISAANNDFIEDKDYPVEIVKAGAGGYKNKITVEYVKRDAEYIAGTAIADDLVDIDTYGLKDSTMKLDGLMTYSRAINMAWTALKRSLLQPQGIKFKLGPKSTSKVYPGAVALLTDAPTELSSLPIRILSVKESNDGELEIEAVEENNNIYDTDYAYTSPEPPLPPETPNLHEPAESVSGALLIEPPPLYYSTFKLLTVCSKPADNDSWAGASVWKAYAEGGAYTRKLSNTGSGVTGTVIAVGEDDDIAYISVELDWGATLYSATDFDTLMTTPGKNLFYVDGRGYGRFQTVELIGTNQWKLTGLIWNTVNFPRLNTYGDIEVDDVVAFFQGTISELALLEEDKYRDLYIKTPSFNLHGEEQSLADVAALSITMQALIDKPLPPTHFTINGVSVNSGGEVKIGSGDIDLTWRSRNRFNTGGYNYNRADAIVDDLDFVEFQIEVYRNSTLLRTVNQTAKSWTYTTAMQSTDGGTGNITFTVKEITSLSDSDEVTSIAIV